MCFENLCENLNNGGSFMSNKVNSVVSKLRRLTENETSNVTGGLNNSQIHYVTPIIESNYFKTKTSNIDDNVNYQENNDNMVN